MYSAHPESAVALARLPAGRSGAGASVSASMRLFSTHVDAPRCEPEREDDCTQEMGGNGGGAGGAGCEGGDGA